MISNTEDIEFLRKFIKRKLDEMQKNLIETEEGRQEFERRLQQSLEQQAEFDKTSGGVSNSEYLTAMPPPFFERLLPEEECVALHPLEDDLKELTLNKKLMLSEAVSIQMLRLARQSLTRLEEISDFNKATGDKLQSMLNFGKIGD